MRADGAVPETMQAMVIDAFGGPERLTVREVPVPMIGDDDVLVRVDTAGVGVWDAKARSGAWATGHDRFPMVLGAEGSGTIAALGSVALLIKQELLLVIVGGVFVIEALSVVIQVASFRLTGKRVFRMAPIHHHFELSGWSEPKVISRFVIVAIIFALLSLTTLKLR